MFITKYSTGSPNVSQCSLIHTLDEVLQIPGRRPRESRDVYNDLNLLGGTDETCSRQWNGDGQSLRPPGSCLLKNDIVFSRGWNPHPGLTTYWKLGSKFVQRRGRMERKLRTTHRSPATTSYSWVLALQLHYARKCNFSFGDYKIHVPKGEKKQYLKNWWKIRLAFCGHF